MKANKCIIIYDTITGNTTKIAKAIAKVLKARVVRVNKVKLKHVEKYDLVGFGSGIYTMTHHKSLLKLAGKLKAKQGQKAFVFSTAGTCSLKLIWHNQLKTKLLNNGFELMGDFCCKGFDNFGPLKIVGGINKGRPDKKDVAKAGTFARMLKERLKS